MSLTLLHDALILTLNAESTVIDGATSSFAIIISSRSVSDVTKAPKSLIAASIAVTG